MGCYVMSIKYVYIFVFSVILITPGCTYNPKNLISYDKEVHEHILRVNRHGYLLPSDYASQFGVTRKSEDVLSTTQVSDKYDKIIRQALILACNKSHAIPNQCGSSLKEFNLSRGDSVPIELMKGAKVKILVYFHGGLNTYMASDKRMEQQLKTIEAEKTDWHYPIYVSWPSNVGGTILEHWFENREGRWTPWYKSGLVSSPFIIFEDLVGTVAEFPANLYYQFTNDKDRIFSDNRVVSSSIWHDAFCKFKRKQGALTANNNCDQFMQQQDDFNQFEVITTGGLNNIKINRSVYNRTGLQSLTEGVRLTLLTPVRYLIGSIWNGAIASHSWDMMKRRARNIVYPTGDFQERFHSKRFLVKKPAGMHLGTFFQALFKLKSDNPDLDVELTLVGHSMGAIAINNLLNKYQNQWQSTPVLSNIVYMAAAASIEDTLSIVPDILRNCSRKIPFYNLTLNRVAEVAETYYGGLLPSGSLLISIDKYHDAPEHHLKRTFGSEINIHSSLQVILDAFKGIDSPIIFKAFNNENYEKPLRHADFNCLPYWKKDVWELNNTSTKIIPFCEK